MNNYKHSIQPNAQLLNTCCVRCSGIQSVVIENSLVYDGIEPIAVVPVAPCSEPSDHCSDVIWLLERNCAS